MEINQRIPDNRRIGIDETESEMGSSHEKMGAKSVQNPN
jgi:hypothetical protein